MKLTWTDRVQEGDIVYNINKMSALSGVRLRKWVRLPPPPPKRFYLIDMIAHL